MVRREIEKELILLAKEYPVVTITGPRQAGKTTLARYTFPNHTYVNLEQPDIRTLAVNDPHAFFNRFKTPVIIDEIQRVPELLSYIQVISDEIQASGTFILTGSNQLQLNESITQSLAGRSAMLKLLPFTVSETAQEGGILNRDDYLTKGFLPRVYDKNQTPFKAYGNYLETYIERDLRQQINIKSLSSFRLFLKLLAGRVGQVINLNSLSNDVGVSSTTLSEWLSVLETSYIIYKLAPYYENFGKRLIKSPKLYFTEVGLVSYLLDIQSSEEVSRDPLLGGLFENMVVMDILKTRYNQGLPANLYYFRDNHGNEVDLLIEKGNQLVPVEIKAAMTFHERFAKTIFSFQKLTTKASRGIVVYAGELQYDSAQYEVRNFVDLTLTQPRT